MKLNDSKKSFHRTFTKAKDSLNKINLTDAKKTLHSTKKKLTNELHSTYKTFQKNYLNPFFQDPHKTKAVSSVAHAIKWKAKNH